VDGFATITSYIQTAMLMLLPIAGMMLVFYSAYQIWNDFHGGDRKKVVERMRDEQARKRVKSVEMSILRNRSGGKKLYETILEQISLTQRIQTWISQADLPFSGARMILNLILAAAVVFTGGLLFHFSLWLVASLAAAILVLPVFVIKFLAKRRMNKLVLQLPDVFDMLCQSLRAGHALASGIQLVGKQLPDPVGSEFTRIFQEQNLGIKLEEALRNFAARTDQMDVKFFVTAVLIQRQTGGDLAEVLQKIGSVIRERITIMGQVKALTAEGRMSGWVLSALPFFVFLLAWGMNPTYAGVLLYEKEGQILLGGAIFMQAVGMLMIKKIVNIKI